MGTLGPSSVDSQELVSLKPSLSSPSEASGVVGLGFECFTPSEAFEAFRGLAGIGM